MGGRGNDDSDRADQMARRMSFSINRRQVVDPGRRLTDEILNTPSGYRDWNNRGLEISRTGSRPATDAEVRKSYKVIDQEKARAAEQRSIQMHGRRSKEADNSTSTGGERTVAGRSNDQQEGGSASGGGSSPTMGRRRHAFGGHGALSRRTLLARRGM